jgi:hypothetical protein
VQWLLDGTVRAATTSRFMKKSVALAAIDGTGLETRHIGAYFVKRRARAGTTGYETTVYTRYPTANMICDCASHLVLGIVAGRGPGPDDPYFRPVLKRAAARVKIVALLAEPGTTAKRATFTRARNAAPARSACSRRAASPRHAKSVPSPHPAACSLSPTSRFEMVPA